MRKFFYAGSLFIAIFTFAFLYCEGNAPRVLSPSNAAVMSSGNYTAETSVLRLHVVANSDSEEDQRVKLMVRDALLEKFAPATSLEQAEEVLLENGADVLQTVEDVLREEGFEYSAQLRFGMMDFPDRTYADISYPAGEYEALKVELGNAQGQNWWCVLFPPLCLTDIGTEDLPDTDELVFESDLWEFFFGGKA